MSAAVAVASAGAASAAEVEVLHWWTAGGEAAALEAMGATASAARILTALASNPNRAMDRDLRLVTLADGARLWLAAGAPDEAGAALDAADQLVYLEPTRVNLQLAEERAPDVQFLATREHAYGSMAG